MNISRKFFGVSKDINCNFLIQGEGENLLFLGSGVFFQNYIVSPNCGKGGKVLFLPTSRTGKKYTNSVYKDVNPPGLLGFTCIF